MWSSVLVLCLSTRLAANDEVAFQESLYFHTFKEMAENKRDEWCVNESISEMSSRKQTLGATKSQLKSIEHTVEDRLKKNLIKELIRLTFETVNQIVSPGGKVQLTVNGMLELASEMATDAAKSHFSSPYIKTIEGVREESKNLLRELDELDRAMKLSREAVIADAYRRRWTPSCLLSFPRSRPSARDGWTDTRR